MLPRLLFFLVAVLLATPVLAQKTTVSLGVRGGLGAAGSTTDPDGNTHSGMTVNRTTANTAILAWHAGAVLDIRRGRLALQPGVMFVQQGYHYTYTHYILSSYFNYDDEGTERRNSVQVPVDIVFTPLRDHVLQLLAGGYAGLGVGGNRQGSRTFVTSPSPSGSYQEALEYGHSGYDQRVETGLRLGVGYQQGPLQLQLLYAWGLTNLHQHPDPARIPYYVGTVPNNPVYADGYHDFRADEVRSRAVLLTGTYFFTR